MKKANADVENLFMSNEFNYFELLSLKEEFNIDKDILYKNFLELQKLYHPDKLLNKSHIERLAALELASKINHAYETLNDDKKRAEYLLFLKDIVINQETGNNIIPESGMLAEILELSEDANQGIIETLKQEAWNMFKLNYEQKNFEQAAQAIIKIQYLNKLMLSKLVH